MSAREREDLQQAEEFLRKAITVGSGTDHQCAAQARLTLANVLVERGRLAAGRRQARLAVTQLSGEEQPRALVQLALIEQRSGSAARALANYELALGPLRKSHDLIWEARLRNNRGILFAYQGQGVAAQRDLRRAAHLYEELGQQVLAAEARWNLGFAAGLSGDLVLALERFEVAGAQLDAAGLVRGMSFMDKCQVLLAAGLLDEAKAAIDQGLEQLSRGDVVSDVAEAWLMRSETLLASGDVAGALSTARDALDAFQRQGRPRFALLARYAVLRSTATDEMAPEWREGAALEEALRKAGWQEAATDVMLMSIKRDLSAHCPLTAAALANAMAATASGPVPLRMTAWHTVALARLASGHTAGASRALRAGLGLHERYRATLSATELQVHAGARAGELAETGLRLALASGDPIRVLSWAERWRAGGLLARPVKPPKDEVLAARLTELRTVALELQQSRFTSDDTSRLERRQRALEKSVTERARAVRADTFQAPLARVEELSQALNDVALVEFVQVNGTLLAVAVTAGASTLHDLGPKADVLEQLDALRFAQRRLAAGGSNRGLLAATNSVTDSARSLDELLLVPLRERILDRPLVVVPTGDMHVLPWGLLPSASERSVTVAPSASVWLAARERRKVRRGDVVLVAGPGLPGARDEIAAVARVYGGSAHIFTDEAASVETVINALQGAGYAHLAAHGRFRADNPLLSSIELEDGPMTVYDLENLESAPTVVVLSACDSGLSAVHPGDELMGLVGALLRMGTRALIATTSAVPDEVARDLMVAFHQALQDGLPPGEALLRARRGLDDAARLRAASVVCFGAG